ncbi:MAG: ATP-binding cassette domain-containing protein [Arachnia propionica]|uniref:ABC transporter ATP-binding protein n=1 Tax=Arachnia propionica TaxID=1750 RepID=UPI002709EE7A|nr:ATP-binding cassette domain-containing protein [Arachnia propionica]
MSPVIRVRHLRKEFVRPAEFEGRFASLRRLFSRQRVTKVAVDDVSFDIDAGELVGYLGSNGAGKSTTIKMLTGILVPTSGQVEVAGHTPWRERRTQASRMGVVFGQRSQLWYDLPLRDSLEVIRDLYGIAEHDYRQRLGMFTELLDMTDFLETPVRFLSLGQRMRGDLTAALLHQPTVVYLDEPTVGLDVVAKQRIRQFIAEINQELGTTVILTTHDMDDVEALCQRVVMIDQGRVLFDGSLAQLRSRYVRERTVTITPAPGVDPAVIDVPGTTVSVVDGKAVLTHDPEAISTPQVIAAVTGAWEVADLTVGEASLSDVVARIYAEHPGR